MFDRLDSMKKRKEELDGLIAELGATENRDEWLKLVKEHAALAPAVDVYDKYLRVVGEMDECRLLANGEDKEMAEIARNEYDSLKVESEKLLDEIKIMLLPKDPMDDKNVIIEIRSGAGGEEASLFGMELFRMYHRFAERLHWAIEDLDVNETELGGVKEATFMIKGKGAYRRMKYESGVHRVQRVPETESQGRVHTSTITVAVLPENEETDFEINEKDLKIDTYRSGGAGGQHINKTDSAVRITHIPTGTVVSCQDERSQFKNREKAMRVLKSRLSDHYRRIKDAEYAENRKIQIGTGDRSERIRTYNYPQGRVTDHRIGYTEYNLAQFLDGDMFRLIEALSSADRNAGLSKIDG